jgi:hypothetical protein
VKIRRNESTPKNRDYWEFVDKTSRMVDQLPGWMKGSARPSAASSALTGRNAKPKAPRSR